VSAVAGAGALAQVRPRSSEGDVAPTPPFEELLPKLGFTQAADGVCYSHVEASRVGCRDKCPCRWYEYCYPKRVLLPGGEVELRQVDVGDCGPAMLSLVAMAVGLFLILLVCTVILRSYLMWSEQEELDVPQTLRIGSIPRTAPGAAAAAPPPAQKARPQRRGRAAGVAPPREEAGGPLAPDASAMVAEKAVRSFVSATERTSGTSIGSVFTAADSISSSRSNSQISSDGGGEVSPTPLVSQVISAAADGTGSSRSISQTSDGGEAVSPTPLVSQAPPLDVPPNGQKTV